jgi:glycosyltransferase involved in cell wall biosynthesis
MRISVITPTADQPLGMALAEQYMARQTLQPDEWIVADDGVEHAKLTLGQTHLKLPRLYEGGRSLANNILEALPEVTGDVIVIWEHDDWYARDHIETSLKTLGKHLATGSSGQRYYNVQHRMYLSLVNRGSALCNTTLRYEAVGYLRKAALQVLEHGGIGVDRLFWDAVPPGLRNVHKVNTMVGIKGLPGRLGLGVGHRPKIQSRRRWRVDMGSTVLKLWVGQDYLNYTGAS